MRVPDYLEPITGYRVWNAHDNGLLCGRYKGEPWPVRQPMVARCHEGSRAHLSNKGAWKPAPQRGCHCGIYAFSTLAQAKREEVGGSLWFLDSSQTRVWGSVKLWGRVLELERGYRAEFAYPAELFTEDAKLAKRLEVYGVPVLCEPRAPEPQDAYEPLRMPGIGASIASAWTQAMQSWQPLQYYFSSKYVASALESDADVFKDTSELIWLPPETARSPLEQPDTEARERRSIRKWREVAHGR